MRKRAARSARQQTSPRPRYDVCPYCRVPVKPHWREGYCQHCYRTFATGKYDKPR